MTRLTRLSRLDAIVAIDEAEQGTTKHTKYAKEWNYYAEIAKNARERELSLILDSAGKVAGVNMVSDCDGVSCR